jgi:tetratricopeptide (TPR) repeat protein
VAALGLLAYSNTFSVPFLFDDEGYILENPAITDPGYMADLERAEGLPLHENVRSTLRSRHLVYLSFAMNHRLHGLQVTGYHAVNLAVHILNAALLYFLVILTFKTPCLRGSELTRHSGSIALLSALLFVSHPLQTGAVTYISQRFASLAAFFYLLSLVSYVRSRLSIRNSPRLLLYALAVLSAICAMKSKETAFTLPAAVALYEFFFFAGHGPEGRRAALARRVVYLLPLFLTMLIIPLSLIKPGLPLGEAVEGATRAQGAISRVEYIMTQPRVVVTYIRLLLLPVNQNLDHGYPTYGPPLKPAVFLSSVFLLMVLALGAYSYYRSRRGEPLQRLVSFGVFWFFIALSVESSVISLANVMYEHRVYLPSVGAFVAAAAAAALAFSNMPGEGRPRKAAILILLLLPALFTAAAYKRNAVWQSGITIWSDVVGKSPGNARGHFNLGLAFQRAGMTESARMHYEAALDLEGNMFQAHLNLGQIYGEKGLVREAAGHFQAALEIRPDDAVARRNLALLYEKAEKPDSGGQ